MKKTANRFVPIVLAVCFLLMLAGCGGTAAGEKVPLSESQTQTEDTNNGLSEEKNGNNNGVFDHATVLGDKDGYSYDKFDHEWKYYEAYVKRFTDASFVLGLQAIGEKGGDNLSETDLYVKLLKTDGSVYATVSSIDLLIDDEVYSFKDMIKFESGTSMVLLGENGNLLIEALGFCDANSVSVRVKTDKDTYTIELDAVELTQSLKEFCRTYLVAGMWNYCVDYDYCARVEAKYPLYISGEQAEYSSMNKDRDIARIDDTFTVSIPDSTPAPTAKPTAAESDDGATVGEKNALKRAQSYLSHTAFSRNGSVEQLEYEGFTAEQCEYAVDHCNADWYEQAVKKAKSYLSHTAFSRNGLVEQLEYEGFTAEQAEHGADNCGADWFEQAVKKANSYLSHSSFSRASLIEQLIYEGFTNEQAEYAVDQVGF